MQIDAKSARTTYDFLLNAGLNAGPAIGVLGNLVVESGLNPHAVGDGGLAHGIAQWHPDRWNPMVAWAHAHGYDPFSLVVQLAWAVHEASTPDGGMVWGLLLQHRTVEDAAALWMRRFERPADQSDAAAHHRASLGIAAAELGHTVPPQPIDLPHSAPRPTVGHTHVIEPGDTLTAIAAHYRTTLQHLAQLNPSLFNAAHHHGDLVQPGEVVRLP